jgi:hypothetical protein
MLATPWYITEQKKLHARPKGYGGGGHKWAELMLDTAQHHKCRSLIDYGCGQNTLVRKIKEIDTGGQIQAYRSYDPAIPDLAHPVNGVFDLVSCTDVLEHIEPECLDNVLDQLRSLTGRVAVFVVSMAPTNKWLSDGRNGHLIVKRVDWWKKHFEKRWSSGKYTMGTVKREFIVELLP